MCVQVDMTWSGHVHVYERTCPILYHTCLGYNDQGIPNAPVHMAIGNGGVRRLLPCARSTQQCLLRLTASRIPCFHEHVSPASCLVRKAPNTVC